MKTSKLTSILIALALTLSAPFAVAEEPAIHNPYTVLGVQLRAALIADASDGASAVTVGPAVFQEIIPCRLISTLEADHYSPQWGRPSFAPNESRSYRSTGELVDGAWTNPCSQQIPVNALAIAARVWAVGPASDTAVVWVTPGNSGAPDSMSKVVVREGERTAAEATFVLRNHMFTVTSQLGSSDIVVDVIGYFLPDPWGRGEKGDKGDAGAIGPQGPKGDAGAQGTQGAQGSKGDAGPAGSAGAQGLKGDNGAQGEKGERGIDGAAGAQGAKGDKGERGEAGAQGLKGDKGERGEAGAQGLKGDKGDKGERGEAGAQGLKGDKGDKGERGEAGAQGLKGDKGDKGDRGEAGAQGSKGDKGERGEQGATGAQGQIGQIGPQGPQGPAGGPYVSSMNCLAQGENKITISNSAVHVNSAIMVTVTGRSLGNIISVLEQGEGWLTVSGKPATCFRFVVFN
jgi:Collagen triple helix repeat (20 copies)